MCRCSIPHPVALACVVVWWWWYPESWTLISQAKGFPPRSAFAACHILSPNQFLVLGGIAPDGTYLHDVWTSSDGGMYVVGQLGVLGRWPCCTCSVVVGLRVWGLPSPYVASPCVVRWRDPLFPGLIPPPPVPRPPSPVLSPETWSLQVESGPLWIPRAHLSCVQFMGKMFVI